MADLQAQGKPLMISIAATVTRADGTVEDLGTVSYWHANPIRRLIWRIGRIIYGRRHGR